MAQETYIHGTTSSEQDRLAALNRLTNRGFLDFLDMDDETRILEVGSGLGILAAEVAASMPRAQVVGLEYSSDQLRVAQTRTKPGLRFVQGDAHQLPFADEEFDLIYCRYLLEHVSDPRKVLSEMTRALKKGGRVCIQENNILIHVLDPECPVFEGLWKKFALLQSRLGGDALIGKRLFSLATGAGLHGVEISLAPEVHAHGQPSFTAWIENLIGNVDGARAALVGEKLASDQEIDAAVIELRNILALQGASAIFYWNRAQGWK